MAERHAALVADEALDLVVEAGGLGEGRDVGVLEVGRELALAAVFAVKWLSIMRGLSSGGSRAYVKALQPLTGLSGPMQEILSSILASTSSVGGGQPVAAWIGAAFVEVQSGGFHLINIGRRELTADAWAHANVLALALPIRLRADVHAHVGWSVSRRESSWNSGGRSECHEGGDAENCGSTHRCGVAVRVLGGLVLVMSTGLLWCWNWSLLSMDA